MNSLSLFLVLGLLVVALDGNIIGRMQSAAIRGHITCNGEPAAGLKIKLYDHDTFTPDDIMARGVTGPDGSFYLAGHKSELTRVVPELRIYHKCGHFFFRHCTKIRIPQTHVNTGSTPEQIYDAGNLRLESMTNNC